MKVYIVSFQFVGTISGGEGVHVTELTRELVKKGIDTTVLTIGVRDQKRWEEVILEDPYEKNEKFRKLKVSTYRFFTSDSHKINNGNEGTTLQLKTRAMEFSLQVTGFLRGQPNQNKAVVHLHGHYLIPSMAKEIKLSTGFKVVSSVHRAESIYEEKGILSEHPEMLKYLEEKELNAINYSDVLIVRSQYIKDLIHELYQNKITNQSIEVLPSAVSMPFINEPMPLPAEREQIKEKLGIKGDLILTLNVIEPLKAMEYIVQALPLLTKKMKKMKMTKPITIIIAGHLSDNHLWYFNKLQKIVTRFTNLKLRKCIRFMTNIDTETKEKLFLAASVFLHTAIAEPFGITIAEALVKNNIVIATDSEGPRLILGHEGPVKPPFSLAKYGLIMSMTDLTKRSEHITEAIIYALSNRDSLSSMTQSAHNHVIKKFSWASLINKKIAIYERLLNNK